MEKILAAEFDECDVGAGIVQLETDEFDQIVVKFGPQTIKLIESQRDQWGVYHTVGGLTRDNEITLAQEDGTRSFLDALIKCLIKLKERTELDTKEATIV